MPVPDRDRLREALAADGTAAWAERLLDAADAAEAKTHGDQPSWEAAIASLPDLPPAAPEADRPAVRIGRGASEATGDRIRAALSALKPWRKGPFEVHGVRIDAEWRSDLKWARIAEHVSDLRGRRVLDVGCGNGYYALRMLAAGAHWVIGSDPTRLFSLQYRAIRHFMTPQSFWLLPAPLEDLPVPPSGLDTVFSLGVLYHRRSPFGHLARLGQWLRPGGELVLETLVIDGGDRSVLVPPGRYARMRNVWFIPSVAALIGWLQRSGFRDARCVDRTRTVVDEQRRTDWMPFESLKEALDPRDDRLTIEGHPAPSRATIVARRA